MKASGWTPQVSFHPSQGPEIIVDVASNLEVAKSDPEMLKKYVRAYLPFALHLTGYLVSPSR